MGDSDECPVSCGFAEHGDEPDFERSKVLPVEEVTFCGPPKAPWLRMSTNTGKPRAGQPPSGCAVFRSAANIKGVRLPLEINRLLTGEIKQKRFTIVMMRATDRLSSLSA